MPAREDTPDASLIRVTGLAKAFGGHHALRDVNLDLEAGEVHALLGGNGAGKSTLIKILAGVIPRDSGEIRVAGRTMPLRYTSATANNAGLAFVHQDLGLVEMMSVAENIALAVGYPLRRGLVSFKETHEQARSLLRQLGMSIPPETLVQDLSQDAKVMVAVARALGLNARAVVLDEVSSSLPAPEVSRLAESLRRATASGIGFIYVTHRLDELDGLADRVTVLRDGRQMGTRRFLASDRDRIVELIVGTAGPEQLQSARDSRTMSDEPALRVRGLTGPSLPVPIDLDVRAGEVVAFCGLVGCGARELAGLLGGAVKPLAGVATLDGTDLPLGRPHRLRNLGCAYVPGDRQREGALPTMAIRENMFVSRIRRASASDTFIKVPRTERRMAGDLAQRFAVRPGNRVDLPLHALSGGNQQKVIAARAVRSEPKVLVLDDPTAGIDVGARAELHSLILDVAAQGAVVLIASTDYDEVAALADRAFVFSAGQIVAELTGEDLNAETLARRSYSSHPDLSLESL